MTPAEELRAAAELLRTLATAPGMQPGPWLVYNRGGSLDAVYSKDTNVIVGETYDAIDQPQPAAPYIAAMHPGVGTALADLLDHQAGFAGLVADLYAAEGAGAVPDPHPDFATRHALAIARALLGTVTDDGSGR